MVVEDKFTFQRNISNLVLQYGLPIDLVLNLDQTSLFYVFLGWYKFLSKGSRNSLVKGLDDKRKIFNYGNILFSETSSFLPVHLINEGKSKRCVPKVRFLSDFNVTFTPNHH